MSGKKFDGAKYGSKHRRLREKMLAQPGKIYCWLCGMELNKDLDRSDPMSPELDHVLPVSTHPQLRWDESNVRLACRQCNRSRGNSAPAPGITRTSRDWNRKRGD